jgi:threonine synthase
MKYYSTQRNSPEADLPTAVVRGLAPDRGLYMPARIPSLPPDFFRKIGERSFHAIACEVAEALFGEDIPADILQSLVRDALSFDTPLLAISENIYALELFHGPTLAFKDVGARFMARLLGYFLEKKQQRQVDVLVATSGDTGSAVANGFLDVPGIRVHVLYPQGKVSPIQEAQFTTLGRNIRALAIDGTFDDCQALVKAAFIDRELNEHLALTSANSINIARLLPQTFYYFRAFAQLAARATRPVFCVPSGNLGNLTAGLIAHRMGLPARRFIAANNRNDVFLQYLSTGQYAPRPSVPTLANAMDVGDPSNFARILDLYGHSHAAIVQPISGFRCDDETIAHTIRTCYDDKGYLLDPHGACGYRALSEKLQKDEIGIFLATAHPAKFKDSIDPILGADIALPQRLQTFLQGQKQIRELPNRFEVFKAYLLD